MRIIDFELRLSTRNLKEWGIKKSLLIRLMDEHGAVGFGEIAPLPGRSIETFDEVQKTTIEMGKGLLKGNFQLFPLPPSILFGFSSALNDLAERPASSSFTMTHLSFENEPPLDRFLHVKIKASPSVEETEERIRGWLKFGAKVRVDINEKWDLGELIAFVNRFEMGELLYVEDPVPFRLLDYFASQTHVSIAIDKTLGIVPLDIILAKKSVTHLIIKPTLIGGQRQCYEIAAKAIQANKQVVYSSAMEGLVGLSHIVRMGGENPFGVDTLKRFEDNPLPGEESFNQGKLNDPVPYFECMQKFF